MEFRYIYFISFVTLDGRNTLYILRGLFYRETRWTFTWRIREFLGRYLL
jgi:hypothetical protein